MSHKSSSDHNAHVARWLGVTFFALFFSIASHVHAQELTFKGWVALVERGDARNPHGAEIEQITVSNYPPGIGGIGRGAYQLSGAKSFVVNDNTQFTKHGQPVNAEALIGSEPVEIRYRITRTPYNPVVLLALSFRQ